MKIGINNDILKGMWMQEERATVLSEISEYVDEQGLKGKEISEQFQVIFKSIIAPNMLANSDFEPINLLSKSIDEFEKIKNNLQT